MWQRERQELIRIARQAGEILMEVYATDFSVDYKEGESPVTVADKRVNEYIVAELTKAFPGDHIVAEESDQQEGGSQGRCWFVDPLDGTKEFIKRNGEFSTMIGLSVDGSAQVGVVYRPVGDLLYFGAVGQGASLFEGGEEKPLVMHEASSSGLRFVVSRSHRSASTDEVATRLEITDEVRSGSVGLKCGLLAKDEGDLYVHLSNKACAWDACGPEAILRAAGGSFTDCFGKPFVYGRSIPNLGGILACRAGDFDRVVEVVADVAAKIGLEPTAPA